MPKRIQRKRTAGWRMPEGAVYVGRPGKFGNPYKKSETSCIDGSVFNFECALWIIVMGGGRKIPSDRYEHMKRIVDSLEELRGKDLACWCRLDEPCHADVLLEMANRTKQ